jgi:hypothetical protein
LVLLTGVLSLGAIRQNVVLGWKLRFFWTKMGWS